MYVTDGHQAGDVLYRPAAQEGHVGQAQLVGPCPEPRLGRPATGDQAMEARFLPKVSANFYERIQALGLSDGSHVEENDLVLDAKAGGELNIRLSRMKESLVDPDRYV